MKKIILLVLGMVFLTSCGNNGNTNRDSVAVAPEKRESFTENPFFTKKENKDAFWQEYVPYVKNHEYNTFLEAFEKRCGSKETTKELYKLHKKEIENIEKEISSKVYFVKGENYYYFTTKEKKIGFIYVPYLSDFKTGEVKSPSFPTGYVY